MVLETTDQQTNIKNITLESPVSKTLPFDPDRDISDKDKEYFDILLRDERTLLEHKKKDQLMPYIKALAILYPQEIGSFPAERLFPIFATNIVRAKSTFETWDRYLEYCMIGLTVFPDKFQKPPILESDWPKISNSLLDLRGVTDSKGYFNNTAYFTAAANLKLLYPDYFARFWNNNSEEEMQILEIMIGNAHDWEEYSELVLARKILDPEGAKQKTINWDGMKQAYNDSMVTYEKAILASRMKILSAEEIKIDDKGLTLKFPNENISQTPGLKLPEARKF